MGVGSVRDSVPQYLVQHRHQPMLHFLPTRCFGICSSASSRLLSTSSIYRASDTSRNEEFQNRNKTLVSEGVLTQPIDFLFDLIYNPQTQLTTMSIQHKKGAPTTDRNGTAQPDVVVTLSNELASILGFRKVWYREIGEYTSENVANVDTVNAIYVYCDVIEHRTVGHTLAPLLAVLPVTGKTGAYVSKRYDKIQYHPVLKKNLSDIHISLRDDQGKRIRFRKGKVIVTLHLRPRKLNSL